MATKTRNISLPPAADEYLNRCVRRYGNASAVVQAGLRALEREEMGELWREWQEAKQTLPAEPITPEAEDQVVRAVRKLRAQENGRPRR
jgi:putative addiction module CopG family antidote